MRAIFVALTAVAASASVASAAPPAGGTVQSSIMEIEHKGQVPSPEAMAAKLKAAYDAEIADQNRRSEALNAEVHDKLRAVDARNAATRAAYDKAMADYRDALVRHDASAAKVQADYDKQVEAWKAATAACKAGDRSKCAPSSDGKAAAP